MKKSVWITLIAIIAAVILFDMIFVPEITAKIEAKKHAERTAETVLDVEAMPLYLREAVMAYNDLLSPEEITYEMLDTVTSLRISYDQCVTVAVNGELYDNCFGPYILPRRMEEKILPLVTDRKANGKICAFFQKLDYNDPNALGDHKSRIEMYYPEAVERVMYVFDPFSSEREKATIFTILEEYVFTNGELVRERTLDLSCLSVFKNLEYVEYFIDLGTVARLGGMETFMAERGMTFTGCPVELRTVEDYGWDPFDRDNFSS